MAENGTAGVEPKGLFMSLDAIIKEKGPEKKEHHPRQRNEGFQNGSNRGRGRRGPDAQGGRGRGRFHAVPQQGWQARFIPHACLCKSNIYHLQLRSFLKKSVMPVLAVITVSNTSAGILPQLDRQRRSHAHAGTSAWLSAIPTQYSAPGACRHWSRKGSPRVRPSTSAAP